METFATLTSWLFLMESEPHHSLTWLSVNLMHQCMQSWDQVRSEIAWHPVTVCLIHNLDIMFLLLVMGGNARTMHSECGVGRSLWGLLMSCLYCFSSSMEWITRRCAHLEVHNISCNTELIQGNNNIINIAHQFHWFQLHACWIQSSTPQPVLTWVL